MRLLTRAELTQSLNDTAEDSIFLDPLLRENQVGAVSIDLRLGYDFLVSVLTRSPAVELVHEEEARRRGIQSYFQETRRSLGERFVLYPHQLVLSATVEYLSLPKNIYTDIVVRSSYARLGIGVSTSMQPGWRGCVPLELFNHGNTPVELIVGSCICQAKFFQIDGEETYVNSGSARKYFGSIRPTVSKAERDEDLKILSKLANTP
ncbi:dCTP deaminase [Polaromonas aquatica]|uniref:dCTP deaminase n=1 Tax=Polaromonas aquatica TaxID=332657 RepID=UPI003D65EF2C